MAWLALLVALLAPQSPSPAASDARTVTLTPAQAIARLDSAKLQGPPVMLAWSPDGRTLYLEAIGRNRTGTIVSRRHFLIDVVEKVVRRVEQQPAWVSPYWTWKSALTCPASRRFGIDAESRRQVVRATAAPFGGDLARGGLVTESNQANDAASAAIQSQMVTIQTLKVAGHLIGEWTNETPAGGYNFGWAPAPLRLIAFANPHGGPLTIVDDQGRKQTIGRPSPVVLPAWSEDATRLAWVERSGKKRYEIVLASISNSV